MLGALAVADPPLVVVEAVAEEACHQLALMGRPLVGVQEELLVLILTYLALVQEYSEELLLTLMEILIHLEAELAGLPLLLQELEAAQIGEAAAAAAGLTPQARERLEAIQYLAAGEAAEAAPVSAEGMADRLSLAAPAAPAE